MEAARLGILARLYCLPRFNFLEYQLYVYRALAYANNLAARVHSHPYPK